MRHNRRLALFHEAYVKTSSARVLSILLLAVFCAGSCLAQDEPPPPPPRGSGGIRTPPPPLPKYPDVRQPGETGFFIGLIAWFPTQGPIFNHGHNSTFTDSSYVTFQGKPKYAEGAEIGIAVGLHNAIHLTYFEDRAAGNFTNTEELRIWDQVYPVDNVVSTNYRLQNAKISFDYLTWPYPVQSSRFRLKTLWAVEYTSIKTGFDLPLLPTVDSAGNPLTDATGNPLSYIANGSHWLILPSFGVGVAEYLTRNIRLEGNASGFAIPQHTTQWDADASANLRTGHLEIRVGVKAFHFKTSTQQPFYMRGTQASGFVGLRWYSD